MEAQQGGIQFVRFKGPMLVKIKRALYKGGNVIFSLLSDFIISPLN